MVFIEENMIHRKDQAKEFMKNMDEIEPNGPPNLATLDQEIERIFRSRAKAMTNRTHLAKSLGISRATLYRYLDKYGIV